MSFDSDFDRELKRQQTQHAKRVEQKHLETQIAQIAEGLRRKGASEQSVQTAIKGAYEIFKPRNVARRTSGPSKPGEPDQAPDLTEEAQEFPLSKFETREVKWLWEGRIPLGKITMLDGDPGLGKSLLALNVAARVSTGQSMPDGTPGKQGSVVLIAPEDGVGDTIKPRLEAAGGDPSQVFPLNTIDSLDVKKVKITDRPFSLSF